MQSDIIDLFNTYNKAYNPNQGADAREFKADQKEIWRRLGSILSETLSKRSSDHSLSNEVDRITSAFVEQIDNIIFVSQSPEDNTYTVRGLVPLIEKDQNFELIASSDFALFLGAFIVETLMHIDRNSEISAQINKFRIVSSIPYSLYATKYMSMKYAKFSDIDRKLIKIERNASRAIKDLEENSHRHSIAASEGKTNQSNAIRAFEEQKQALFQQIKNDAAAQINARLNAQDELDKIRYPVQIWAGATKRHKRNFLIGLSLIFLLVSLFTYTSIFHFQDFISRLGLLKDINSQNFSPTSTVALATIVAILAAAGYFLKILGRFVTNSLTLSEDAEVRAALADTFIGLTAEDTSLTKEARDQARTVMLAALFRPLPGHQQEDITAPTVLSLAQDLLKKPST